MASAIVRHYLEEFIQKNKSEFTNLLDIGCVGSEYESFIAANISEYSGCDILSHDAKHDYRHNHIEANFRYLPVRPRYHLITAVNIFNSVGVGSYKVDQPYRELITFFQKIYTLALTGVFMSFDFGRGGIIKDTSIQVSGTILDAMLATVIPAYVNLRFVKNDEPMPMGEALRSTKEDPATCILTIKKDI